MWILQYDKLAHYFDDRNDAINYAINSIISIIEIDKAYFSEIDIAKIILAMSNYKYEDAIKMANFHIIENNNIHYDVTLKNVLIKKTITQEQVYWAFRILFEKDLEFKINEYKLSLDIEFERYKNNLSSSNIFYLLKPLFNSDNFEEFFKAI